MATEVTIPQLGESVTEGTITAWLVDVGDHVEADQPLFELSSDKVDTEVPAPTSGVLKEIKVNVDETVDVGTVVAVIGDEDEAAAQDEAPEESSEAAAAPAEAEEDAAEEDAAEEDTAEKGEAEKGEDEKGEAAQEPTEQAPAAEEAEPQEAPAAASAGNGQGADQLMSPIVRRMVSEHDLDVSEIEGTGQGGRITREDVEAAIEGRQQGGEAAREAPAPEAPAPEEPAAEEPATEAPAEAPAREAPARTEAPRAPKPAPAPAQPAATGERKRSEDLSRIRQRIAGKMMESLQSSAQLTTVQEADVSAIMSLRARLKDDFRAREGVSLSPFAFLCRAAVLAIRHHPTVNAYADWEAGRVTYHDYVNLGIAVDTDKGLIVPNVKNADDLSLPGLARGIANAADKARGKGKLEMQDIEGGTFTMTNTGSRGVLLDTPILNYPEVGILATGAIQKRPIVVEAETGPAIAVRDMVYLCLTYDHRLIDGADAARYVTEVKRIVEEHDWAGELGV